MEMPEVAPFKDDDPFITEVMGLNLEAVLDYHLHVDVATMDDKAVDRLEGMWPIHRDRWLGHYGLTATIEPGERNHEHLVVHDSRTTAIAKIPSGLSPSDERMWLKTNPVLHSRLQTADERFDENMELFPELEPATPAPPESIRQTRLSKIAVSVAAFAMMTFGR
jgi:hypothetical protein